MRNLSKTHVKVIRFVVGPLLLVIGLFLWNYMLSDDMQSMLGEAFEAGQQPNIDFAFMLKGLAPLAVALVGLKLVTWKRLGRTDE
jgi:hypothetical protein